MSFSDFSKFLNCNDITLDEALSLLLSSIASEEMSLSRLIDAETNKIMLITKERKCDENALRDILDINRSVDSMIKNITKLQMILQYKLENVKEILPASAFSPELFSMPQCPDNISNYEFRFIGKGKGFVTNTTDEFYYQTADLQVFINNNDIKKKSIHYFVENDNASFKFTASEENISIDTINSDRLILTGSGEMEKRSKFGNNVFEIVEFTLVVLIGNGETINYRLLIKSDYYHKTFHDSGIVQLRNKNFDLHIGC